MRPMSTVYVLWLRWYVHLALLKLCLAWLTTAQSIAMENLCSRVSAYLYMGASVQMAFSLGLHRDQLAESGTTMEREKNRRIWWTLFQLDQELSSRGGSPTVIDERFTKVTTPMPSEQVSLECPVHNTQILTFMRYYIPDSIPRYHGWRHRYLSVA